MMEVELWTADGHFVAIVDLPPFPHAAMPEVVTWGVRTFLRGTTPNFSERRRYREVFAYASVTPSPGRGMHEART